MESDRPVQVGLALPYLGAYSSHPFVPIHRDGLDKAFGS
jgi:hypothetical protein